MTTDRSAPALQGRGGSSRRRLVSLIAALLVIAALTAGAVYARAAIGGASGVRAAGAGPVEQPTALPSVDPSIIPSASLPPELIDPVTGQKIWWSVGGALKLSKDALTQAAQADGDTACPDGEECPDPLAP